MFNFLRRSKRRKSERQKYVDLPSEEEPEPTTALTAQRRDYSAKRVSANLSELSKQRYRPLNGGESESESELALGRQLANQKQRPLTSECKQERNSAMLKTAVHCAATAEDQRSAEQRSLSNKTETEMKIKMKMGKEKENCAEENNRNAKEKKNKTTSPTYAAAAAVDADRERGRGIGEATDSVLPQNSKNYENVRPPEREPVIRLIGNFENSKKRYGDGDAVTFKGEQTALEFDQLIDSNEVLNCQDRCQRQRQRQHQHRGCCVVEDFTDSFSPTVTSAFETNTGVNPLTENRKNSLQKSRDFLYEIFMARGRNRNKQQQQHNVNGAAQQQQNKKQQQQQQQLRQQPKTQAMQQDLSRNSPIAVKSTNSRQTIIHQNQNQNTKNNNLENTFNNNNTTTTSATIKQNNLSNVTSNGTAPTSPASTNSYQMTTVKNSNGKNATSGSTKNQRKNTPGTLLVAVAAETVTTITTPPTTIINSNSAKSACASNSATRSEQQNCAAANNATRVAQLIQAANVDVDGRAANVRQLHELTECDRDRLLQQQQQQQRKQKQQNTNEQENKSKSATMGQSNVKPATATATAVRTPIPTIQVHDCSQQQQQQQQQQKQQQQQQPNYVQISAADAVEQHNSKWSARMGHAILENVPEQEEEEAEEDDGDDDGDDDDEDELESCEDAPSDNEHKPQAHHHAYVSSEYSSNSSPECSPLKTSSTANTSDSNLSTSMQDSGISCGQAHAKNDRDNELATHARAPSNQTPSQAQWQRRQRTQSRSPFTRDGSSCHSTDCDETLLQCDELDDDVAPDERLVCIESISLPDVVVESTSATSGSNADASATAADDSRATEHIININGASGNVAGKVHFIPISVEGGRSRSGSPKQRSYDDSAIGAKKDAPTVEIIEEPSDYEAELLRKELIEEKSRFSVQLEDAQRNLQNLQNKIGEMQRKIEKLEIELSNKTWNVERLQSELNAAQKDDEFVRKRLKFLEDEKITLRHKHCENEDEFKRKYAELETQTKELRENFTETQKLVQELQKQLACARDDAEGQRCEVARIREELEEQIRILKNALENSEAERKICEDRWQKEFEMLRTYNRDREDSLMTDCEWQLRQMQKQCKDKVDKAAYERKQSEAKANELESELEQRKQEVSNLRVYQAQVNSLRGVVTEQERSLQILTEQLESLRAELELANENLSKQIDAVARMKYECDNAIYDKERQVTHRIDEVRNEAAAFWEDKLYTEMTRLKTELESVYVDERRDALDKLQIEHVEELRALTNRYTANEDELRAEIVELQELLDRKNSDFLELREKSDNALLQTRMHLDRADREYQTAMCREEERRELLEQNLRKEFDAEKREMDEKFSERLDQLKAKFGEELQDTKQQLTKKQHLEMEQIKAKLNVEKDQALQELNERYRKKMAASDEKIKEIELRHQRDLKDLKAAYDSEKAALDKRDISNANEIEQLHRKCRCLTNLFEEMRMRYERRDPRPEDLREITELRTRCESQERDLYLLTDRLREMQIQMAALQQNGAGVGAGCGPESGKKTKPLKKPPPKALLISTNCDVIYEENEERESPPPPPPTPTPALSNGKRKESTAMSTDEAQMITAV